MPSGLVVIQMADDVLSSLEAAHLVALCNRVLVAAGLVAKVSTPEEVLLVCSSTSVFVAALEAILRKQVQQIDRRPASLQAKIANCSIVIQELSKLLGIPLEHISAHRVVEGNVTDIVNLLELIGAVCRTQPLLGPPSQGDDSVSEPSDVHNTISPSILPELSFSPNMRPVPQLTSPGSTGPQPDNHSHGSSKATSESYKDKKAKPAVRSLDQLHKLSAVTEKQASQSTSKQVPYVRSTQRLHAQAKAPKGRNHITTLPTGIPTATAKGLKKPSKQQPGQSHHALPKWLHVKQTADTQDSTNSASSTPLHLDDFVFEPPEDVAALQGVHGTNHLQDPAAAEVAHGVRLPHAGRVLQQHKQSNLGRPVPATSQRTIPLKGRSRGSAVAARRPAGLPATDSRAVWRPDADHVASWENNVPSSPLWQDYTSVSGHSSRHADNAQRGQVPYGAIPAGWPSVPGMPDADDPPSNSQLPKFDHKDPSSSSVPSLDALQHSPDDNCYDTDHMVQPVTSKEANFRRLTHKRRKRAVAARAAAVAANKQAAALKKAAFGDSFSRGGPGRSTRASECSSVRVSKDYAETQPLPVPSMELNPLLAAKLQHLYNLVAEPARHMVARLRVEERQQADEQERRARRLQLAYKQAIASKRRNNALKDAAADRQSRSQRHQAKVASLQMQRVQEEWQAAEQSRRLRAAAAQERAIREAFLDVLEAEKERLLLQRRQEKAATAQKGKSSKMALRQLEQEYLQLCSMVEDQVAAERGSRLAAERESLLLQQQTTAARQKIAQERIEEMLARVARQDDVAIQRAQLQYEAGDRTWLQGQLRRLLEL